MIWKICKLEFVRMVRVELRDFWGLLRKDREFSKIIISAHAQLSGINVLMRMSCINISIQGGYESKNQTE